MAVVAIPVLTVWNALVTRSEPDTPDGVSEGDCDPRIIEHECDWVTYLRWYDAHNGPEGSPEADSDDGSLWRGLGVWAGGQFMRGYTVDNHVYLCPNAPRLVRIHQAAHAPVFGAAFEPLRNDYREQGGLPDEPLLTFDVMLPGRFPHSLLRFTDRRGLAGAYTAWLHDGTIRRVRE